MRQSKLFLSRRVRGLIISLFFFFYAITFNYSMPNGSIYKDALQTAWNNTMTKIWKNNPFGIEPVVLWIIWFVLIIIFFLTDLIYWNLWNKEGMSFLQHTGLLGNGTCKETLRIWPTGPIFWLTSSCNFYIESLYAMKKKKQVFSSATENRQLGGLDNWKYDARDIIFCHNSVWLNITCYM